MAVIEIFPGQGSQQIGMGGDLFQRFPRETEACEKVLGYSLAELCNRDPRRELNQTQFTQPALFVVSALTCLRRRAEGQPEPAAGAGHSLGEYTALWAAGVFNLTDGVKLVQERGRLMAAASHGGMAAVLGIDEARVRAVLVDYGFRSLDVANLNGPDQIVVSGPREDIEEAKQAFVHAGARNYVILPVSAAFHSRYMKPAAEQFRRFLAAFPFSPPCFPVYANVTAAPYPAGDVPGLLARQIVEPVRWTEIVRRLLELPAPEFVEVGPGSVLTHLVRRIQMAGAGVPVH